MSVQELKCTATKKLHKSTSFKPHTPIVATSNRSRDPCCCSLAANLPLVCIPRQASRWALHTEKKEEAFRRVVQCVRQRTQVDYHISLLGYTFSLSSLLRHPPRRHPCASINTSLLALSSLHTDTYEEIQQSAIYSTIDIHTHHPCDTPTLAQCYRAPFQATSVVCPLRSVRQAACCCVVIPEVVYSR